MKEILANLALIDLNNYCTEHGLHSPRGSHLTKSGRGFQYSLVENGTGRTLATVFFSKSQVPTHCHTIAE